ncbi:MAG: TfoX/Sxy family protein [Fimbriimonadaceae bacterium]
MPVSPAFRDEVVSILSAACNLRSRPMFGGYGLYSDDVFFAVIDDDRLYFKIGPENLADYEALGAEIWVIGTGDVMKNYRELPSQILQSPAELSVWIEKSVAAAINRKKKSR